MRKLFLVAILALAPLTGFSKSLAYIYGDVAPDGTTPSGDEKPFQQMRLSDEGKTGCSEFLKLMEGEGFTVQEFYDQETELTPDFLGQFDVVVFGLHQKKWSDTEKQALDSWLQEGGGMLIYSDSAVGGHFGKVGLKNPIGQEAVNNLITPYGLQVTVDQGGGIRSYSVESDHPILKDGMVFEGEGVSPVAVDPASKAKVLIPFNDEHMVDGKPMKIDARNVTVENPTWAAMALAEVGKGHVIAIFDRQPMWNAGPGSDITKKDNTEVLRRMMNFLAGE